MFTMDPSSPPPVMTRQKYSREFKSMVVAQARHPHVSIAAVALSHGLNANLLRKWIKIADPNYVSKRESTFTSVKAMACSQTAPAFVPVKMPAQSTPDFHSPCIEVEVQNTSAMIKVKWPLQASNACLAWLREMTQ